MDINPQGNAAEFEEKFRSLMDGITEIILIIDPEGKIVETNNRAQTLLGYTKEELLTMHLTQLYPKTDHEKIMVFFNGVFQKSSGSLSDTLMVTKGGKMISVAVKSRIVESTGNKVAMVFVTDITEYKQSETLMSRFAYFSELNPNPIVEIDIVGRVCYINPVAKKLFPDLQNLGLKHPFLADIEPIIKMFLREEKDFLIREIKINDVYYQEYVYCVPEKQFVHIYGLDITELKNAEDEVMQSERLSALGKFSAGVAHEVRNPLSIILGSVEFLEKRLPRKEESVRLAIINIKEATQRATEILQNMLKFSKPPEGKIERISPKSLVEDALSLFRYSIPMQHIGLKVEFEEKGDTYIEVDAKQLEQAIFNLLINASEAMPNGGDIKVKTYTKETSVLNKPACVIEVADKGPGISKENLDKIFEPFFTTKGKRGTGLGLTTARMIVKSFKGVIKIDSELNKGTSVKIFLPVVPPSS